MVSLLNTTVYATATSETTKASSQPSAAASPEASQNAQASALQSVSEHEQSAVAAATTESVAAPTPAEISSASRSVSISMPTTSFEASSVTEPSSTLHDGPQTSSMSSSLATTSLRDARAGVARSLSSRRRPLMPLVSRHPSYSSRLELVPSTQGFGPSATTMVAPTLSVVTSPKTESAPNATDTIVYACVVISSSSPM